MTDKERDMLLKEISDNITKMAITMAVIEDHVSRHDHSLYGDDHGVCTRLKTIEEHCKNKQANKTGLIAWLGVGAAVLAAWMPLIVEFFKVKK